MNDSADLRRILKTWPYDSEHDARIIRGEDGREVLQVRTPLGLEQYEMDGRPDGLRPHGMETALEHHLHRLNQAKFAGREAAFELSPQECSELFHEGTLYYFRYVRLFQLKDWTRTVRDTARNLRAFDFLHRYARREGRPAVPGEMAPLHPARPCQRRGHARGGERRLRRGLEGHPRGHPQG